MPTAVQFFRPELCPDEPYLLPFQDDTVGKQPLPPHSTSRLDCSLIFLEVHTGWRPSANRAASNQPAEKVGS